VNVPLGGGKDAMASQIKHYIVSAHPSLFDTFFKGLHWSGYGHVAVVEIKGGGINSIETVIEADDQGYVALKTAGFNVRTVTLKGTSSTKARATGKS
jgi:hypothetical protein